MENQVSEVEFVAYDIDNETLIYDYYITTGYGYAELSENLITIIPNQNWFGEIIVDLIVSDGEYYVQDQFLVGVIEIADPNGADLTQADYSLALKFTDLAGNIKLSENALTFNVDRTPPNVLIYAECARGHDGLPNTADDIIRAEQNIIDLNNQMLAKKNRISKNSLDLKIKPLRRQSTKSIDILFKLLITLLIKNIIYKILIKCYICLII